MMYKFTFFTLLILTIALSSVRAQTPTTEGDKATKETAPIFTVDPNNITGPPSEMKSVQTSSGIAQGTMQVGVVNKRATSLPKPTYPPAAKAVKASGAVTVEVLIDEQGDVVSASAVSGHPLLRQAAVQAARQSKFKPTLISGQPVKISGIIVYNFVGETNWMDKGLALGTAETKGLNYGVSLPPEFSNEQEQLNMLVELPIEEQKAQIIGIVSQIKSRLSGADAWRFEFGLAKGRILNNPDNNSVILMNLAKFKELAYNNPAGVQEYEIKRAAELAKFVDKGILTKEDTETIFSYLK